MLPQPYAVQQVLKETADTFTLTLEQSNGVDANRFQPGQFSMLWVFGVGEVPISISGDPADPDHLVYTVRSVGEATHMLVSRGVGDAVGVRGPFGKGWPVKEAEGRDVVIVAGGIGLAPLRPVIYEVLHNREKYGRLVILYGTRSPHDRLYRTQLADLGSATRYAGVNHSGLWRPKLERPCGRGYHVVQVCEAATRTLGSLHVRARDHDAICGSRSGNAGPRPEKTFISPWNET